LNQLVRRVCLDDLAVGDDAGISNPISAPLFRIESLGSPR